MMKKIILLVIVAFFGMINIIDAQGVYFEPSPTDVTSNEIRLYVDITSDACGCPELADADPESNPLFIWAWNPNEARPDLNVNGETFNVQNGEWGSSNENLQMTQDPENPDLWYFDFLGASLVQFYNVPAETFYQNGIDFLIKERNGAPADLPEQKSPDLNIIPEPVGCFDKVCPFPTTFFQDDYFFITYDSKQEANPGLRNGDAYFARLRYRVNGGNLQELMVTDESEVAMTNDGDGIFSFVMIPEEFFGLSEGDILDEIQVSFTKPPLDTAPYSGFVQLIPGCPE
jgi:hypothetical protein